MGLYNTLHGVSGTCPECGETVDLAVQFKFGYLGLDDYRIGDRLRWTRSEWDVGQPGFGRVLARAVSESCPCCHERPFLEFEILIEGDKIVSVRPVSSWHGSDGARIASYLVLEP